MGVLYHKKKRPDARSGRFSLTKKEIFLRLGLRLLEAKAATSFLPLPTLLEEVDALEALENVPLRRNLAGTLKRCMLTHCLLFLSTSA